MARSDYFKILESPFHKELMNLLNNYQGAGKPNVIVNVDNVDPRNLLPKGRSHFTYQGSLTTPPCSEIATWIVFTDAVQVSAIQAERVVKQKFGIGFRNARRHTEKLPFPYTLPFHPENHKLKFRK